MAAKKIPQNENRNKLRVPLQGSPTITSSPTSFTNGNVQGCKYVNCFPVEIPQFGTDPIRVLNKAPGLDTGTLFTVGGSTWTTMGQIVQYFDQDQMFIAKGNLANSPVSIGKITPGNISFGATISSFDDITSPVIKVYNQAATTPDPQYFYITVSGGNTILNIIDTSTFTISSNAYGSGTLPTQDVISVPPVYMNNRAFFLDFNKGLVFNTDPINGAPTYTVGNFLAPQIMADKYMGMVKYRNHICVIGQYSIEFFYDGGLSLGSPLVRQEQYLIRHGCTSISNVVMYGDIMYFLGFSDTQGWGLYEVANFNLRKVSPPGIDAIFNNTADFAGLTLPSIAVNIVDVYGHAVLLFQFQAAVATKTVEFVFEIPKRPYGIMAPTDGQWWEWPALTTIPQQAPKFNISGNIGPYIYPLIFHTLPQTPVPAGNSNTVIGGASVPYNTIPSSFYWTYPSNTTAIPVFISKNRASSSTTTGTIITDVMDFDENAWKHVDYIDCIGDFGNNTVTLSWTNDPTYQSANWVQATTQNQSVNGPKNVLRWHNPGPFRQMALRYDFTGTSNIVYKGSEISFNMGTM
jgi:hypothetical protein